MMRKSRRARDLLPAYLIGKASPQEQRIVEGWLREGPEAKEEFDRLALIRKAVRSQTIQRPAPAAKRKVMAHIREHVKQDVEPLTATWRVWALVLSLAVAVALVLWVTIRPGIDLQWNVTASGVTTYRLYRAPLGTADFGLIHEVTAQPDESQYAYVDMRLIPGQEFVYQVEAVGQGGERMLSPIVKGSAIAVLPSQIAILATSLIIAYSVVLMAQAVGMSQVQWRNI